MPPPNTERFCLSCKKITEWSFNRVVGHSRCTECGGMYSSQHEIPEEQLTEVAKRLMPWINNNTENNRT